MAKRKIKYNSYRWLLHILVWVVYFSITFLPVLFKMPIAARLFYIGHFIILAGTVYMNIYGLMKLYFYKEEYRKYIFSLIALLLLGELMIYGSSLIFDYPPEGEKYFQKMTSSMLVYCAEFIFLSMYKIAKELYFKTKRSKELEFEKMQAELVLLRSQLDAHFLFNTLNNIYLLVLNKSAKAADAILMLSDLLSYNIYDSRQQKVDVAKECEFIENYINLQKLRLNDDQKVFFDVEGDRKGLIEPLILFNFIENAFKHAADTVEVNGKMYYVYMKMYLDSDSLTLTIVNGYKRKEVNTEGVGIVNARKRLDIVYGENYELDIDTSKTREYRVHLKINELQ